MIRDIRSNYMKFELTEELVNRNPVQQLIGWLNEAIDTKEPDPTAMILSTVDKEGFPDSRVVLLKEIASDGLIFFTNYNSRKGEQLSYNPHVSVVFLWSGLERQVRVKGLAEKISEEESEIYFQSRPLESQLGAWASPQSQVIKNRQVLHENYSYYQEYFKNQEIKKPPHWGGYIIRPEYFEFWQGRSNRLHDRIEFHLSGSSWKIHRLAP